MVKRRSRAEIWTRDFILQYYTEHDNYSGCNAHIIGCCGRTILVLKMLIPLQIVTQLRIPYAKFRFEPRWEGLPIMFYNFTVWHTFFFKITCSFDDCVSLFSAWWRHQNGWRNVTKSRDISGVKAHSGKYRPFSTSAGNYKVPLLLTEINWEYDMDW